MQNTRKHSLSSSISGSILYNAFHIAYLGRDKIVDFHWNSSDPWTIVSVSDDGESTGGGGTLQVLVFLVILQRIVNWQASCIFTDNWSYLTYMVPLSFIPYCDSSYGFCSFLTILYIQIWRMSDLIYRPEEEVLTELENFKSHLASCTPRNWIMWLSV